MSLKGPNGLRTEEETGLALSMIVRDSFVETGSYVDIALNKLEGIGLCNDLTGESCGSTRHVGRKLSLVFFFLLYTENEQILQMLLKCAQSES